VIAATSFHEVNMQVYHACQSQGILINVADTPELCDFYLGSIVTKGDLKIAISTNGKSPTFAKRFRELLEENLPDSIDGILSKLSEIRNKLSGDFQSKVQKLDEITDILKDKGDVLEEK
jgi:precorrin-2 dehydrogenase/sirohydrochlorin ferrochelatase